MSKAISKNSILRRGVMGISRRVAMSMILAVPALQSSIAPSVSSDGSDPIFAVIDDHKNSFLALSMAQYDDMIHCMSIDTTVDPEPFGLVTWRNFMIGYSEVDRTRDTLVFRYPDEAEAIKSEAEMVRIKSREANQRRQD